MENMTAVAVPIFDVNERLVSTLSLHAPDQRLSLEAALHHVPTLKAAATKLSNLLSEKEEGA